MILFPPIFSCHSVEQQQGMEAADERSPTCVGNLAVLGSRNMVVHIQLFTDCVDKDFHTSSYCSSSLTVCSWASADVQKQQRGQQSEGSVVEGGNLHKLQPSVLKHRDDVPSEDLCGWIHATVCRNIPYPDTASVWGELIQRVGELNHRGKCCPWGMHNHWSECTLQCVQVYVLRELWKRRILSCTMHVRMHRLHTYN